MWDLKINDQNKFRECGKLLDARREELAYIEVMDIGKPIIEARADVQTAIDAMHYCGGNTSLLSGETAVSLDIFNFLFFYFQ